MEINVSQDNGKVPVTIFKIKGDITSEVELQDQANAAHEAGSHHILLDLSEVPYMSSAGLRALHYIFSILRTHGDSDRATREGIASGTYVSPHLKLYKPNNHVLEVLKTAGYDMFLQIHNDYKKAIASF
jgi:anti-anti-sigma factor